MSKKFITTEITYIIKDHIQFFGTKNLYVMKINAGKLLYKAKYHISFDIYSTYDCLKLQLIIKFLKYPHISNKTLKSSIII